MDLSVLLPSCLRRRVLLGLVCWCCCNSVLWAQDSAMVSVDSLETTETVQTDSIVAATRPLPAPMMTADCKPVLRPKDVLVPVVITGLAALYVQNHHHLECIKSLFCVQKYENFLIIKNFLLTLHPNLDKYQAACRLLE